MSKMDAPIPVGVPDPPPGDYFTDIQWTVLFSLLDAVFCPIVTRGGGNWSPVDKQHQKIIPEELYAQSLAQIQAFVTEPPSEDLFRAYLAQRASQDPLFVAAVRRTVGSLSDDAKKQFGTAMAFLA